METRTLTPERWLISGCRRASDVNSAMSSLMYSGTTMGSSAPGNSFRSTSMMEISCAISRG